MVSKSLNIEALIGTVTSVPINLSAICEEDAEVWM
jgi:hypothetical protein